VVSDQWLEAIWLSLLTCSEKLEQPWKSGALAPRKHLPGRLGFSPRAWRPFPREPGNAALKGRSSTPISAFSPERT